MTSGGKIEADMDAQRAGEFGFEDELELHAAALDPAQLGGQINAQRLEFFKAQVRIDRDEGRDEAEDQHRRQRQAGQTHRRPEERDEREGGERDEIGAGDDHRGTGTVWRICWEHFGDGEALDFVLGAEDEAMLEHGQHHAADVVGADEGRGHRARRRRGWP